MDCLVLMVKKYQFTSDNGQELSGLNVQYLDDEIEKQGNINGQQILKVKGNIEKFEKFSVVPGFYDLVFK